MSPREPCPGRERRNSLGPRWEVVWLNENGSQFLFLQPMRRIRVALAPQGKDAAWVPLPSLLPASSQVASESC